MPAHWLCQYQTPDDRGASRSAPYADFDTEAAAQAFAEQRSTAYGLPAVVFPIGGAA